MICEVFFFWFFTLCFLSLVVSIRRDSVHVVVFVELSIIFGAKMIRLSGHVQ